MCVLFACLEHDFYNNDNNNNNNNDDVELICYCKISHKQNTKTQPGWQSKTMLKS